LYQVNCPIKTFPRVDVLNTKIIRSKDKGTVIVMGKMVLQIKD